MKRRWIAGIVLLTVLLAGAYSAYWFVLADRLRASIDDWAAVQRSAGWIIDVDEPAIAGFPLNIVVTTQRLRIGAPGNQWLWVSSTVTARARPWSPGEIKIVAPGRHQVLHRGRAFQVQAADARARLVFSSDAFRRATLTLAGVTAELPDKVQLRVGEILAGVSRQTPSGTENTGDDETAFNLAMRAADLPAVWRPALGPTVQSASLEGILRGRMARAGRLAESLTAWRDSGGVVDLSSVSLRWGALAIDGDGTVALDRDLQPQAALTTELAGLSAVADALVKAGVIGARTMFALKVAAAMTADGRATRLPVSVQNRRIFIGPVPLIRIKPIRWE